MSSDLLTYLIPVLGLTVVTDVFALYAAYLSISVARGMTVPVYRSRALWLAAIGILGAVVLTDFGVTAAFNPNYETSDPLLTETIYLFPLTAILIWIDRTVNTVIRLDFLRRDVLLWRRLRYIYGSVAVVGIVVYYSRYYYPVPDGTTVGFALIFSELIYGMVALARGATVTRDMTFKVHIRWFGLFLFAFIVSGFIYELAYTHPSYFVPIIIAYAASSYCLFRMAKSLVPSGKLSASSDPQTGQTAPPTSPL